MKKLVTESLKSLVNEEFSVRIKNSEISSKEDEIAEAKSFSWSPPSKPITVKSLKANVEDDYNTVVELEMSNGDAIIYEMFETRTPRNGQSAPPWYSFSLKINGVQLTHDLEDVLTGSTGTIVGDILLYYKEKKGLMKL